MLSGDFVCFVFSSKKPEFFACGFQLNRKTSPCFFPTGLHFVFKKYHMQKNLFLLSCQGMTTRSLFHVENTKMSVHVTFGLKNSIGCKCSFFVAMDTSIKQSLSSHTTTMEYPRNEMSCT